MFELEKSEVILKMVFGIPLGDPLSSNLDEWSKTAFAGWAGGEDSGRHRRKFLTKHRWFEDDSNHEQSPAMSQDDIVSSWCQRKVQVLHTWT
jgi:hypothetical protein